VSCVKIIIFFSLILFTQFASAQQVEVNYHFNSSEDSLRWFKEKLHAFDNEDDLNNFLAERQSLFQKKGYLLYSYSIQRLSSQAFEIKINFKRKFDLIKIDISQIPDFLLYKAGFTSFKDDTLKIYPKEYLTFKEKILDVAARNGFPFAKIWFINSIVEKGQITSTCSFISGSKIYFDSLSIGGDVKINSKFLASYLGIHNQSGRVVAYDQSLVDAVTSKISKLNYLELTNNPEVLFEDDKAILLLKLKNKKASRFDGMLGLLPSSGSNSRPLINGYLNVHLYNPLGKGKEIKLNWLRVKQLSPIYKFSYYHPQFLKSDFNLLFNFLSLQQDSLFRNIAWQSGFTKKISLNHEYGFYYSRANTISLDESGEITYNLPSSNSKMIFDMLGFTYSLNSLDNLAFPKNGWYGNFSFELGKRRDFNDSKNNTNRFKMELNLKKFSSISKSLTFVNQLFMGYVVGGHVFSSEMFRVGGINNLRGFDENFFYTTSHIIHRLDLRLNLEENSYLIFFNDLAYLNQSDLIMSNSEGIVPYSFGTGLNLKINKGQLQLIFGLGATNESNLTLNTARFHFGYTTLF